MSDNIEENKTEVKNTAKGTRVAKSYVIKAKGSATKTEKPKAGPSRARGQRPASARRGPAKKTKPARSDLPIVEEHEYYDEQAARQLLLTDDNNQGLGGEHKDSSGGAGDSHENSENLSRDSGLEKVEDSLKTAQKKGDISEDAAPISEDGKGEKNDSALGDGDMAQTSPDSEQSAGDNNGNNHNRPPQPQKRPVDEAIDIRNYTSLSITDLFALAKEQDLPNIKNLKYVDVIFELMKKKAAETNRGTILVKGVLEILSDGYGFLRTRGYALSENDVYVSPSQIRRFDLRTGDLVIGLARIAKENEKYSALLRVDAINMSPPDRGAKRVNFDSLVPIFPDRKISLEWGADRSTRVVDLFTPIGFGQRGLIVAPPKTGKTTLLKKIANAISRNYPDITLMVLLIDERPEEVTDIARSIDGEVVASTFDEPITQHIRVSEMVLERARRLVEQGKDVVIMMDSITRLARAYNLHLPSTGQTLSGGVNPAALYKPKRFFGSARNIEHGGSLTILATALVDTGSRMDEIIFEEFKGTGNMELLLDRKIFEKRIFPSIDITRSSTRKDELLVEGENLAKTWILRKFFTNMTPSEAIDLLLSRMKETKTNDEFLSMINEETIY